MYEFKLLDRQKEYIADAITRQLRAGVTEEQIFRQIEKAAQQYIVDHANNESILKTLTWNNLTSQLFVTLWRKRGRPQQRALREYLKAVVLIYYDATGFRFGRRIVVVPFGSTRGSYQADKPHPFIVECLAAIHKRYTPNVFQEALQELKTLNIDEDPSLADWLHPKATGTGQ